MIQPSLYKQMKMWDSNRQFCQAAASTNQHFECLPSGYRFFDSVFRLNLGLAKQSKTQKVRISVWVLVIRKTDYLFGNHSECWFANTAV